MGLVLPAVPTTDPEWLFVEEGYTLARMNWSSCSQSATAMRDRVYRLRRAARSPHLRLSAR